MRFEEKQDLWIDTWVVHRGRLSWGAAEVVGGSLGKREKSVQNKYPGHL